MVESNSERQDLLRLKLVSRNQAGLFERLKQLNGLVLNSRYLIEELFSVGGQSVLYLARDIESNTIVVVKIPFLPYQKSAYFSNQEILNGRFRLQTEATILRELNDKLLPKFVELVQWKNPLLSSARGDEIINNEYFLVIEYLHGKNHLDIAQQIHKKGPKNIFHLEKLVWKTVVDICDFFIFLESKPKRYFYTDLTPSNLFLTKLEEIPVRLLDAGSIITSLPPIHISAFTKAYIPVRYYEAITRGESIFPTQKFVMYSMGKSFWEILTNNQAYPGEEPDFNCSEMAYFTQRTHDLVADLLTEKFESFQNLKSALDPYRSSSILLPNEIYCLLGY